MMVRYARVRPAGDPRAGEVVGEGHCSLADLPHQARPGLTALERPSFATGAGHYYDWAADEWIERPPMPVVLDKPAVVADGIDAATVSGIPEGTVVQVGRQEYVTDADGVFTFRSRVPGRYVVRLKLFPYRDAEFEIEVR